MKTMVRMAINPRATCTTCRSTCKLFESLNNFYSSAGRGQDDDDDDDDDFQRDEEDTEAMDLKLEDLVMPSRPKPEQPKEVQQN